MSNLYNPTDFFKSRKKQILSMYNNADEILKSQDESEKEEDLKKEAEESDKEELDYEDKKDKKDVEKSENNSLQDEFDILEKSIIGDIEKATYADNHQNRKLGRVGQQYGGRKPNSGQEKKTNTTEATKFKAIEGKTKSGKRFHSHPDNDLLHRHSGAGEFEPGRIMEKEYANFSPEDHEDAARSLYKEGKKGKGVKERTRLMALAKAHFNEGYDKKDPKWSTGKDPWNKKKQAEEKLFGEAINY